VIAQFTDLHLGASAAADRKTKATLDAVLAEAEPDLVVLSGDVLEGSKARDPEAVLRRSLAPVLERGLPWAPVLGNHDDEGRLSRREVFACFERLPGCVGRAGPRRLPGAGNYVLAVRGRAARPAFFIYMLDSHAYAPDGMGTYAWIRHEQVEWYRRSTRDRRRPALAFFHIPLPEWDEAWESGWDKRGQRHEAPCAPAVNSGLFAAFLERGDVVGAFCGHDHRNDYEATLHGIRLVYGRATGAAGYGAPELPKGGRVIELVEGERAFTTRVVVPAAS
jgi:3',5'-cyclic AMP phosphodiesterase CpdA